MKERDNHIISNHITQFLVFYDRISGVRHLIKIEKQLSLCSF
jgi:hypothetical protein